MCNEFHRWGIDFNKVTWMNHPNKDEIDDELLNKIKIHEPSYSSNVLIPPERTKSMRGMVCCTYKHYLSLCDIIKNDYDYGVIIEDNICFNGPINELIKLYIKQLDNIYGEWDICFDGPFSYYMEGPTVPNILVYPKSNEITKQCHGGTKAATFYLIKKECAKKLVEHYIPFNNSPDWWMNDLFRKCNIKSFWVHPSFVYCHPRHISTTLT